VFISDAVQDKLIGAALRLQLVLPYVCQIVSVKEIRRILSNAEVQRLPLPELRSCSKILENHHIQQVQKTSCCVSRCIYSDISLA